MSSPKHSFCANNPKDYVRELLQKKGLNEDLVNEILDQGLTDELARKLECRGFSYEDLVIVGKAFKDDTQSDHFCNCSFNSQSDVSSGPTTENSDYLREHFSAILPAAMREIAMRKPFDPVEYLGQWLLHYRDCEERERRRQQFEAELFEERLKYQKAEVIADSCEDYEINEELENYEEIIEE